MTDAVRIQREQRLAHLRAEKTKLSKWLEAITEVGGDMATSSGSYHGEAKAVFALLVEKLRDMEKRTHLRMSDTDRRIAVLQQAMSAAAASSTTTGEPTDEDQHA